ncbi:MAG: L,D-transpeptidase [Amycolatopsis sp.]|uniref:L,D-transpeptidase n=1 Tax=Amycolatopsis sp. TaxID=37632 RepID=UPI00345A1AC9|nr:L,D-transpeptidase [Amycolatopsis sp.]
MRLNKILVGVSALVLAGLLGACSSGTTDGAAVAPAANTQSTTAPAPSTSDSAPSSTPAPPTTPKTTKPTAAKPVAAKVDGVPCAAGVDACVDLSAHKAWLLKDGKILYGPVPIMPGKKGSTTPVGSFHVYSKEKLHLSKEFNNAPMPNSVFFYPGDAFHTGSLDNYSNGCVHLSSTASLKFFTNLAVGDAVQVVR